MALGARRGRVVGGVLGETSRTVGMGLAIGLVGSLVGGRWIASLLYEVSPTDAVTLACTAIGLFAVAILAAVVPARRAAGIDPVRALRAE